MSWNASRVLWKVIIFFSFSKHKNSGLFFWEKKLWIATSYPFLTLEFSPILHNMAILVLFFLTLEFLPYPSKHWTSKHRNSDLILANIRILPLTIPNIGILALIFLNSGVLILSFETLQFFLSLQTLELCPYPCIHWNSSRVLWNIIFILFSKHRSSGLSIFIYELLISSSYPSKHWPSGLILLKIIILALSFEPLKFWSYRSKY